MWLAPRLRDCDKQEIYALNGKSPERVVPLAFEVSRRCSIIRNRDEEPIAIYGVADNPSLNETNIGHPWLLATDGLVRERIAFLRAAQYTLLPRLQEGYDILSGLVWNANKLHLRWLAWMGFRIAAPHRAGPFGALFNQFTKHTIYRENLPCVIPPHSPSGT